ncbi:MAG TPA: DUF2231 domain-containing protein [Burkholderiales bacterium]|nr:DUF2231 domain-containing protein [Burkholderiales bacterium]
MRTPASIAGHPIHPMLVPLPIGLWIFSLICDLIYVFGWGGDPFRTVAFYCMVGGVIGGLVAAIPGLIDMLSLPARPKRTAIIHMSLNLTIVALFVVNIVLRIANPENLGTPVLLSVIAVGLLTVSGWLGGKLVYEERVAVETGEEPARLHVGRGERLRT